MQKKPMTNPIIVAAPRESNILEWHYVVEGPKDTAFEGGYFWGKLIFPKEYPLKPPGVLMFTPSGRFKPNRRLCLSMSDCECSVSSDSQMMEFWNHQITRHGIFRAQELADCLAISCPL
jgi:ubiquitin-conjugating enzyme E2 J2